MPGAQRSEPASRRSVLAGLLNLAWAVPALLGIVQVLKFLRFSPPTEPRTQVPLGAPEALAGLPAYIEGAQAWLHRDAGGYYAVDAICTHLGCTVQLEEGPQGYRCACHGSRFAPDGAVLNGPATQPLRFLRLYWDDQGRIVVDRTRSVDSAFRLPPL